jgi:hypothetical protein
MNGSATEPPVPTEDVIIVCVESRREVRSSWPRVWDSGVHEMTQTGCLSTLQMHLGGSAACHGAFPVPRSAAGTIVGDEGGIGSSPRLGTSV